MWHLVPPSSAAIRVGNGWRLSDWAFALRLRLKTASMASPVAGCVESRGIT